MNKLDGLKPPTREYSCRIRVVAASLGETDKAIFMAAVDDSTTWAAKTLSNSLKERGLSMTDLVITKHRNGICSC